MMIPFRAVPMPTALADRFRQTERDDGGNAVLRKSATGPSPCRHCLADARVGEPLLLLSYHFGRPFGVYWTPSPIWLHEKACEAFDRSNSIPEIVRNRLVSVRAYDAEDMCLYDLGDVWDGGQVDALPDRCLTDRRTDYVNIHTARPGCFLCRVERI
jgi:hypothetical protein